MSSWFSRQKYVVRNPLPSRSWAERKFVELGGDLSLPLRSEFIRLARRYHPDVAGSASTEQFKDLEVAYTVLSSDIPDTDQHDVPDQPYRKQTRQYEPPADLFAEMREAINRVKNVEKRWEGISGRGRTLFEALCDESNNGGWSHFEKAQEADFAANMDMWADDAWRDFGRQDARRKKLRKAEWIADWKQENADRMYAEFYWDPTDWLGRNPSDKDTADAFLQGVIPPIESFKCFIHGDWVDGSPADFPPCPQCGAFCPYCVGKEKAHYCGNCGYDPRGTWDED